MYKYNNQGFCGAGGTLLKPNALSQPHTNTLSFLNHSLTHCVGQIVCDLQFAEEESGLLSADLLLSLCVGELLQPRLLFKTALKHQLWVLMLKETGRGNPTR